MQLRLAGPDDWPAIWPIWRDTVAAGDTYTYPTDATSDQARTWWLLTPPAETWLAEHDGDCVGTYLLKPNAAGPGDHVANAGFMVSTAARRLGIGRTMAEHCLERARELGYEAMQFNAVVATNTGAVALWKDLGFKEVGRVPGAFRHPSEGNVDLLVMHRRL